MQRTGIHLVVSLYGFSLGFRNGNPFMHNSVQCVYGVHTVRMGFYSTRCFYTQCIRRLQRNPQAMRRFDSTHHFRNQSTNCKFDSTWFSLALIYHTKQIKMNDFSQGTYYVCLLFLYFSVITRTGAKIHYLYFLLQFFVSVVPHPIWLYRLSSEEICILTHLRHATKFHLCEYPLILAIFRIHEFRIALCVYECASEKTRCIQSKFRL